MNEKNITFGIICFTLIAITGWFLFRDVSDNGRTVSDLREQLTIVGEQQQSAIVTVREIRTGLENSERTVDEVKTTISRVEKTNGQCREIINDSQRRIAESKSILQEVRAAKQ